VVSGIITDGVGMLTSSSLNEDSINMLEKSMPFELPAISISNEIFTSIEEIDVRSSRKLEVMSGKKGESKIEGGSVVAVDDVELLPVSLADGEKVEQSIATDSSELCPDEVISSSVKTPSVYETSDDEAIETGASVLIGSDDPAERDALDDSPSAPVT
ncbi:hypothetical protein LTS18_006068, partial [Coniosporium uncinatum]